MTTKAEPSSETVERIGAYRVVRRLATGGTSDVLLAKAEGPHGFERTVVLKVLLAHFGKDDEVSRMFAREASAYARLSHPAIVRLFDFFAVPNPSDPKKGSQLVMVLEYVDGPPLARLKSMAKAIGKELDDKASIYIATCIFDALAAAHSAADEAQIPAPVIHRDVNPSNVLIPWDGYPKLADFGVAKVTGLGHQSVVGMIKGTYGYMAPEQVLGGETITPRADVYAAAIILWELLTRRRAFQRGALPEVEALRAMAEPRLPALESIRSDVDRTVREALRRALEPRAERRKITAEEMVSILTNVVPLDQGRERLMSLLGLVRNDSRAANAQPSIQPPPMMIPAGASGAVPKSFEPDVVIPGSPKVADFGSIGMIGNVTMTGVAPPANNSRMVPKAPRPTPSSAKFPAATPSQLNMGAVQVNPPPPPPPPPAPPRISSQKMPAALPFMPPVPGAQLDVGTRELLSLPTRPALPAVTPPAPRTTGSRPALAAALPSAPLPDAPRGQSASARLADSIPPEPITTDAPPTRQIDNLLESLSEVESRMSAPPDSPRTAAPLKNLTGGLGLRDAIDEILKVPQSAGRISVSTPVARSPLGDSDRPQMRETTRVPPGMTSTLIGLIPPAPAPMTPSGFPGAVSSPSEQPGSGKKTPIPDAPPSSKDEFANANDDEPVETVVHPEPLPPMRKPLAQTLAMEARPPTPHDAANRTGPMPRFTPPGMQAVQSPTVPVPPSASSPSQLEPNPFPRSNSQEPPSLVSRPPQQRTTAPPQNRSEKKAIGVGTVLVVLLGVVGLGIAATIAYVRHNTPHESSDASAPPIVARPLPSALVSVAPVVSSAPVAVVAPPLVVDASVAAVPAVVDAGAPAPAPVDVPAGMGLVKTTNAAPGRRIFVDGNAVGQTPETVTVKCGEHAIKLGSSGKTQDITVPCGADIVVNDVKAQ